MADAEPVATPLADALDRFWVAGGPTPPVGEGPRVRSDTLLDDMPPLGVRHDGRDLRDALRGVYRRFASPPPDG